MMGVCTPDAAAAAAGVSLPLPDPLGWCRETGGWEWACGTADVAVSGEIPWGPPARAKVGADDFERGLPTAWWADEWAPE